MRATTRPSLSGEYTVATGSLHRPAGRGDLFLSIIHSKATSLSCPYHSPTLRSALLVSSSPSIPPLEAAAPHLLATDRKVDACAQQCNAPGWATDGEGERSLSEGSLRMRTVHGGSRKTKTGGPGQDGNAQCLDSREITRGSQRRGGGGGGSRTDRQEDRKTDSHTDRKTDSHIDRKTDRHTDLQTRGRRTQGQ